MTNRTAMFAVVVALWTGVMIGIVVVEHLAPSHPLFFCRPTGNTCEPYPWR